MPRELPVGNGGLLVNFDANYALRDIYWPRVGQENHTAGDPNRFGVWAGGEFAWLDEAGWERRLDYARDSLVTDVTCRHPVLDVELHFADFVDFDRDIFFRKVTLRNTSAHAREVRCFQHIDPHLWGHSVGDTAYYDPSNKALVHYKGKRFILLCGEGPTRVGLDTFAVGNKEVNGQEGTWRDAEDGQLSRNLVAQGSVDSVGAIAVSLPPGGEATIWFWLCFGESYEAVRALHELVLERSPQSFYRRTLHYWQWWIRAGEPGDLEPILGEGIARLYRRSLLILRSQTDNGGAPIAANDADILRFGRDTYSYMWPRDGALIAYAFSQAGHRETPRRFFQFCSEIIQPHGYMLHKYNPDGSAGSSWHPWSTPEGKLVLPIQEDETALVVWALWEYYQRFRDVDFVRPLFRKLVLDPADFMVDYRDDATGLPDYSHDLWEERYGILTFTTAAVVAGLRAAACFMREAGLEDREERYAVAAADISEAAQTYLYDPSAGRLARMVTVTPKGEVVRDTTVDSSLYGAAFFGLLPADDPRMLATMDAVRERLWVKTGVGGVARYEDDYYYQVTKDLASVPGNPWFVCTLWLAGWQISRARTLSELGEALKLLEWCVDRSMPGGVLSEQIHPYSGEPLSVSPLSWSHAGFVTAVHQYIERWHALQAAGR